MSNLLPRYADEPLDIDLSSIGRTNRKCSEEEEIRIRSVQLAAESLFQSGNIDGDLHRREEIIDLICRCKVALALHKKLPYDVLRSIFHLCCDETPEFPLSPWRRRFLSTTHVCSAWRQLALETPALWNNVNIHLESTDWKRHQKTLFSARQWFARAQNMPRSLLIALRLPDRYSRGPHLRDLWQQVLEFIALYPLKELDLEYPIHDFDLTLKLPNHTWPSIERLNLIGNDLNGGFDDESLFSHFGTLSNLKHFQMREAYNLRGLEHTIPWHQLQTLEMWTCRHSEIKPSLCLNVLRQCRLLRHCTLSLAKEPSFMESTVEQIVLPDMEYFSLEFGDGSAASAFLRQPLVIPNITTFNLDLSGLERERWSHLNCDMPALIGVTQRSEGMRWISFLAIEASSHLLDIGVLLELLPSLEQISIKSGYLDDNAIKGLSSGKLGSELYLIRLRYVHDADKILSMVESRYQNAILSPDDENSFCPFEHIWISCGAVQDELTRYRSRIRFLSEACNADICLGIQ